MFDEDYTGSQCNKSTLDTRRQEKNETTIRNGIGQLIPARMHNLERKSSVRVSVLSCDVLLCSVVSCSVLSSEMPYELGVPLTTLELSVIIPARIGQMERKISVRVKGSRSVCLYPPPCPRGTWCVFPST